jgi:hypothetical protein
VEYSVNEILDICKTIEVIELKKIILSIDKNIESESLLVNLIILSNTIL